MVRALDRYVFVEFWKIFVTTAPFVDAAGRIAHQLAARGPQVQHLVHNTAILTAELGRRETELRTLLNAGSATLSWRVIGG